MAWTATAKWSSQLISWASFVVVTRLLVPSDFGLVGMALALLWAAAGRDQRIRDGRHHASRFDWRAIGAAKHRCVDVWFPSVPDLLRSRHSTWLFFQVASPAFSRRRDRARRSSLAGLRTIPYSLLYRDMRFRLLSILQAVQIVAQALTMLALAWLGFGYWTLVLGNIVGAAILATLYISWRPYRFARPRSQLD